MFNEGKIVDASFTEVLRQRNTREENKQIKEGKGDDLWNDNPHKKCHKDIDAMWAKKNDETFYRYKNHVKIDGKSKLIDTYMVSDASVHSAFQYFMTSRTEGLTIVWLEAQACGLPCISFNCETGPSDIINNGENGYLIEILILTEWVAN